MQAQEEQEFTLVARQRTGSTRVSSLYNHIIRAGQRIFEAYIQSRKIRRFTPPSATRNAFILELAATTEMQSLATFFPPDMRSRFETCAFADRHIRIDKVFDLTQHTLLSHWHYTERYNVGNRKCISVHAYFHYGIYLGTYITEPDKAAINVEISLANKARENCKDAHEIIMHALKDMKKEKAKINDRYDTLATKMSKIEYIHTASDEDISHNLEQLSTINQELDLYHEDILDKRFHKFKDWFTQLRAEAKHKKEEVDELDPEQKPAVPTASQSAPIKSSTSKRKTPDTSVDELHKRQIALKASYSGCNTVDGILSFNTSLQTLKDDVLILFCNTDDLRSQKKCLAIEAVLGSMPTLIDAFDRFTINCQVDEIEKLFIHVQDKIAATFYTKFFIRILQNKHSPENCSKLPALCQLFFNNSEDYRLFVSEIDTWVGGYTDERNASISAMLKIALTNNIELFKVLLRQSAAKNFAGYTSNGCVVSLLDALCTLSCHPSCDVFINLMLDLEQKLETPFPFANGSTGDIFEAKDDPNLGRFFEGLIFGGSEHNQDASSTDKDAKELPNVLPKHCEMTPYVGSTLSAYCLAKYQSKSILKSLAERTSLLHLLMGFSYYTFNTNTQLIFSPNKYGIKLETSINRMINSSNYYNNHTISSGNKIRYIGHAFASENTPQFENMSIIFTELNSKMLLLTQAVLNNLLDMLRDSAKSHEKRGDAFNNIACLNACLVVLTQIDPCLQSHSIIMHTLIQIADLINKDPSKFHMQSNFIYARAVCFGIHSQFFDRLTHYEKFLHATRILGVENSPAAYARLRFV